MLRGLGYIHMSKPEERAVWLSEQYTTFSPGIVLPSSETYTASVAARECGCLKAMPG